MNIREYRTNREQTNRSNEREAIGNPVTRTESAPSREREFRRRGE